MTMPHVRLIENIKELKRLDIKNMEELTKLNAKYAQNHPTSILKTLHLPRSKIWYGKGAPIDSWSNQYTYEHDENNLNSVSNLIAADKYFEDLYDVELYSLWRRDAHSIIMRTGSASHFKFVLNIIRKRPEETVKLINKLKHEF